MSFDAEDVMKRASCPECDLVVEDYAPGVSCMTVDGLMYHPACVPALETSELSDAKVASPVTS